MGLTAAGTEIVTEGIPGGLSAVTSDGTAIGGVFASMAFIYVLAYLDLLDAAEGEHALLWWTLVTALVPLGMVFVSIVFVNVIRVN